MMIQQVAQGCAMCREERSGGRATINLPELARLMGVSRGKIYELAAKDELPVKVIKLGKRIVLSRAEVHRILHESKAQ